MTGGGASYPRSVDDGGGCSGDDDAGDNPVVVDRGVPSPRLSPVNDDGGGGGRPRPRRHPRDWLSTLLRRHLPDPDSPLSSLPAYSDPTLRGRALAVAPMVDQSDLPFRLLCRRYGANICWTPMIHARMFVERVRYREKFWNWGDAPWAAEDADDGGGGGGGRAAGTVEEDRPLIAQFCGSDPDVMLEAMRMVEPYVDSVDVNCGCPQGIARRGRYGAFLLEAEDHLISLVRHLASNLTVPVSVKVRLLPSGVEDSLDLYERLVDAGAAMLTVHGRNRFQKGPDTGPADWDAIRRAVERVGDRVPVLANGGIGDLDDARRCLSLTGCDGVMSSEAILEYPALFSETGTTAVGRRRVGPGRVQLSREFLDLCRTYPPDHGGQGSGIKCVRVHLHRFLHPDLQSNPPVRDAISDCDATIDDLHRAVDRIEELHRLDGHRVEDEVVSWYVRHRVSNDEGENVLAAKMERNRTVEQAELDEDAAGCFSALFGDDDDGGGGCGLGGDDEEGDY